MTLLPGQRSLADLIVDLSEGLGMSSVGVDDAVPLLRTVSAEFRLPVDARFDHSGSEATFVADLPRTRMRTAFDPPHGTVILTLVTEPCP